MTVIEITALFHIESLRERDEPLPETRCTAATVGVADCRLIAGRRDSSEAGMDPIAIDTAVAGVHSSRRRANGACRLRHATGLKRGGLGRLAVLRRHLRNELMMLGAAITTRLVAPGFAVRKS